MIPGTIIERDLKALEQVLRVGLLKGARVSESSRYCETRGDTDRAFYSGVVTRLSAMEGS